MDCKTYEHEPNQPNQLFFISPCPLNTRIWNQSFKLSTFKTIPSRQSTPSRRPRPLLTPIHATSVTPPPPPSPSATTSSSAPSSSQQEQKPTASAANGKLDAILKQSNKRRYIFFGGKGGVGKTSTSAAAGVHCARQGLTTLIISTDPAHSLGDALQVDLSDGKITRVSEEDDTLPLYAVESDTRDAVEKFRELISSLKTTSIATNEDGHKEGGEQGWADKLGISEFSDVLQTIPPGADELIALTSVLDIVENDNNDDGNIKFDRIIIDTAPTGHTLRLLTFPDFLDNFLGQALKLKERISSSTGGVVGSVINRMFNSNTNNSVSRKKSEENKRTIGKASERVKEYQDKMKNLSQLFRNPSYTEFVVVTIATKLAVAESKRLIDTLWDEGVWVRHVVVNQLLRENYGEVNIIDTYLSNVRKGQMKEISFATEVLSDEYGLSVSIVPRFDIEVTGFYGLQALGNVAFKEQIRETYGTLFNMQENSITNNTEEENKKNCEFVFVGGKGGVGKTSISASLGVALAEKGMKTLVLSTDPAHSLGDALQIDLTDGLVHRIFTNEEFELYGLEIDSESAISEFQTLTKDYVAQGRKGLGVDLAKRLGLEEFAGLLDNAPPGIDELIALTKVIDIVKFGDFERVIIDTAPTGHTLRLLSFPEFLDGFLNKIGKLKKKLDKGMQTIKSILGKDNDPVDMVNAAADGVERLRGNMMDLKNITKNHEQTQFVVVCVPTVLAMAESERLVKSLKNDSIKVNHLVINQVIPHDSTSKYVRTIVKQQVDCIHDLQSQCQELDITMVNVDYFDAEVRGVYGLQAMASQMFSSTVDQHE